MPDRLAPVGLVMPILRGDGIHQFIEAVSAGNRGEDEPTVGQAQLNLRTLLETGLDHERLRDPDP
jgi:hypothetical protein